MVVLILGMDINMGKVKAWDLEKKAGLTDIDLKEKSHSEICLWFNKYENQIKVLKECKYIPSKNVVVPYAIIKYHNDRMYYNDDEIGIEHFYNKCEHKTSRLNVERVTGTTKDEVRQKCINRYDDRYHKLLDVNLVKGIYIEKDYNSDSTFPYHCDVIAKEHEGLINKLPYCKHSKKQCIKWDSLTLRKKGECVLANNIIDKIPSVKKIIENKPDKELFIISCKWEQPLMSGKFIIGYPDFMLTLEYPEQFLVRDNIKIAMLSLENLFGIENFIVEVKPRITMDGGNSIGKVMRQMKTYMTYGKGAVPIIITKTPEYKEVFEGQGIHYYIYKDDDLEMDK